MTCTDPLAPPPEHDLSPGWGQSLSTGAAGLALLHITYAGAGLAGWDTAHQWAVAMTRSPVAAHPDACLFKGAPAVAFVLRAADQPAYAAMLGTLDNHIATLTRHRLDRAHERIERGRLPELREFDLINGLTGIGMYLLQADDTELLQDVLSYLVRLVEPLTVDGRTLPGWWTGNGPADQPSPEWPGGHANLGLAHGIAGPLALLASTVTHGVTVPGHVEAIERVDAFLSRWRWVTRSGSGGPRTPWLGASRTRSNCPSSGTPLSATAGLDSSRPPNGRRPTPGRTASWPPSSHTCTPASSSTFMINGRHAATECWKAQRASR